MSERVSKKYLELHENPNGRTHLKVELYYDLGGLNYFSYRNEPRGYWLSVTPVTVSENYGCTSESYECYTGIKQCVHECSRRGKKAEQQAIEAAKLVEQQLIDYVLQHQHLSLEEKEAA